MFMVTVRKNQQIVDLGATKTEIKQVHLKLIITPVSYISTGTSPTIMGWSKVVGSRATKHVCNLPINNNNKKSNYNIYKSLPN